MLKKIFLLIYLLVLTANVNATEVIKRLSKLSLEELMNVEVVVASKTVQKISEAPSSVTVFTRQELLETGITSLEELMNFVPGFQATREIVFSNGYMVAGRGRSTTQASFNILFLIDGQRISNDTSGGALNINQFITLANVKQVEIIRGPGSALYGTGAFNGVVNIITATDVNDVFVGKGNLNSKEFYINISREGDNWKASLFARHFEDNGELYETENIKLNPFITKDPMYGNDIYLTYDWDDRFRLNIRHTKRSLQGFITNRGIFDNSTINDSKPQQDFIYLEYKLLNTEINQLSLHGSYLTMEELNTNTLDDKYLILSDIKESEWQFGLDNHYHFNENHKLLAGIVWRKPNIDNATTTTITGKEEKILDNIERDIIGIYLQDQYFFNDKFELTFGVRNDHYSDFGNTINPRAALIYVFNPKTRFKFMYGQAFRSPSFRQISTINPLGNPNLKPETVKTTEFAWLQEYSNGKTALTLFYSQFEDKIDTVIKPNQIRYFENIGGLDTAGIELEGSFQINNFSLRGAYTYFIKTEEEPRRIAEQTFSLIANYKYKKWNFNLNNYYHSDIEQDVQSRIINHNGYLLWNNTIRYNVNNQLTLVSRINNLFDKEYYSSTKITSFNKGILNRGRTFLLGMEMKF
ncbi:MAG: TonB-dependent receptor [Candidatus Marithrix sp.]|nr:TonB-dependent receptor [Candidatus Marithrix sp.]